MEEKVLVFPFGGTDYSYQKVEPLCSLDDWRSWYYRDRATRFENDTFSRVRGQSAQAVEIVQRGSWGKSNIFSICKSCGRMSIYGICQSCGFMTACCVCKKILMPDGSWKQIEYPGATFISHTYCEICIEDLHPGLLTKRGANGNN